MDGTEKLFLAITIGLTIFIVSLVANNFFTDYVAIQHGLHQQQCVGQNGYIWVK